MIVVVCELSLSAYNFALILGATDFIHTIKQNYYYHKVSLTHVRFVYHSITFTRHVNHLFNHNNHYYF